MRNRNILITLGVATTVSLGGLSSAGAQTVDNRAVTKSVTYTVTPKQDNKRPIRFTVKGRINLPPGLVCPPGQSSGYYCLPLPRERACEKARVSVRYKAGSKLTKTISLRRATARVGGTSANPPFCTFRSTVTFTDVKRLRPQGRLKVSVRFLGNAFYKPKSGPTRFVRARIR